VAIAAMPRPLGRPKVTAASGFSPSTVRPSDSRQLEAQLGEVVAAGRELAQCVNAQLVVPLGLLELLATHAAVPADLRPMLAVARDALSRTASQAQQFQTVVQHSA